MAGTLYTINFASLPMAMYLYQFAHGETTNTQRQTDEMNNKRYFV